MRRILIKVKPKISRLDRYLVKILERISRSEIQKLIKNRQITVNKKPAEASYNLRKDDFLEITLPPPKRIQPEKISLRIIYEDSEILVINKSAGMVIYPTSEAQKGTLANAIAAHTNKILPGEKTRPGIVHRLDRGTSGCLVVAKTEGALKFLQEQFKKRSVSKKYLCLVSGKLLPAEGEINLKIERDPFTIKKWRVGPNGKEAKTIYKVKQYFGERYSLLEVEPKTGRTHQIRVHFSSIGHPIVGDKLYGGKPLLERPFLHAASLGFIHPKTGKFVQFEAPLPEELKKFLEKI